MVDSDITIRRAGPDDIDAVVAVGAASLGWRTGEPNEALFRWKHEQSPFGASPIWLAELDGRIAGYRAFMRWELEDGDRRLRAVRAVDTATHPDFQRRGIFSRLTTQGVEEMTAEGVDIVFNTPNTQSRPGYLKLGWIDVGRLPVSVRPTSIGRIARLRGARMPAAKWSEVSPGGVPALETLSERGLDDLISSQPREAGILGTPLTAEYLRWRYRLEPLHYRAWAPHGVAGGVVFFRVRQRGSARECAVASVLVPGGDRRQARQLLAGLAKVVDADYLIRLGAADLRAGFVPVPNQGPRLTARALAAEPPGDIAAWGFQLGDIELF